jgi:hypothetical protein
MAKVSSGPSRAGATLTGVAVTVGVSVGVAVGSSGPMIDSVGSAVGDGSAGTAVGDGSMGTAVAVGRGMAVHVGKGVGVGNEGPGMATMIRLAIMLMASKALIAIKMIWLVLRLLRLFLRLLTREPPFVA